MERVAFGVALVVNFAIVVQYRRRAQAGERFSYDEEGLPTTMALRALGWSRLRGSGADDGEAS